MIFSVAYEDFKRLCDEYSKRIYYYISSDVIDLYFITDGVLIATSLDMSLIENKETFFGDKMFVGAIKLLFKIPVANDTMVSMSDKLPILFDDIVQESKSEEGENVDIQKEAVLD